MKVQTNLKAGTAKADAAICSGTCSGWLRKKYEEGWTDAWAACHA